MTHEPELTAPVDLCTSDGRCLAPAARGWSRLPFHRANLAGGWGRTKRWDYWAVLARDLVVAVTYADVDYLGLASVWWVDLATGRSGGRDVAVPWAHSFHLPDRVGGETMSYSGRHLRLEFGDDSGGTTIEAAWRERDGTAGALSMRVDLPPGHESLNVVIPWSDRRFQFTSKHQARPARGTFTLGPTTRTFGEPVGEEIGADAAWGVLDVGRGRWPYRTRWNWGGGAGLSDDGRIVGLQLGGIWTVGTGFTENGIIVDGRLTKIGNELEWSYDWERPLERWTVADPSGSLEITLSPTYDRHTRIEAGIAGTEVHQVFGRWSGTVTDDRGDVLVLRSIPGFAEESRSRW